MTTITKEVTLNFFSPEANSNKVWIGRAFADGAYEAQWGRVVDGGGLATTRKQFGSAARAEAEVEAKRREKLGKGYRETAVITSATATTGKVVDVKAAAAEQIAGTEDRVTRELVEYLADVNIHNITASTSIRYDASKASFSTPLGVLSATAIADARKLLDGVKDANDSRRKSPMRDTFVRNYFQLVPHDFGRKIPAASELLSTDAAISKESDILDALEAAIASATDATADRIFKTRLTKLPHWTPEGRAKFREIRSLFDSTKNAGHGLTSSLKLTRVYEVEIEDMKAAFDASAAKLGNVRSDLWHGTKASNLLSILRSGLVIPPSGAAHCTGRMFGNGIYTSLQSTKALNYATNMWGSGGATNRRFMFLCDVALGKSHKPASYGGNFPARGTDSTWVEPGTAGVMNHEAIVYNVDQINLRYLCEFSD